MNNIHYPDNSIGDEDELQTQVIPYYQSDGSPNHGEAWIDPEMEQS